MFKVKKELSLNISMEDIIAEISRRHLPAKNEQISISVIKDRIETRIPVTYVDGPFHCPDTYSFYITVVDVDGNTLSAMYTGSDKGSAWVHHSGDISPRKRMLADWFKPAMWRCFSV